MSNDIVNVYRALSGDSSKFKDFYFFFKNYILIYFRAQLEGISITEEVYEDLYHNTLTAILCQFKNEKDIREKWQSVDIFKKHLRVSFKKEILSYQNLNSDLSLNFDDWCKLANSETDVDKWLDEEIESIFPRKRIKKGKPKPSSDNELEELKLIAELNDYIQKNIAPEGRMKVKLNINVNKVSRGLPSKI